jgi:hypothetical protein
LGAILSVAVDVDVEVVYTVTVTKNGNKCVFFTLSLFYWLMKGVIVIDVTCIVVSHFTGWYKGVC